MLAIEVFDGKLTVVCSAKSQVFIRALCGMQGCFGAADLRQELAAAAVQRVCELGGGREGADSRGHLRLCHHRRCCHSGDLLPHSHAEAHQGALMRACMAAHVLARER